MEQVKTLALELIQLCLPIAIGFLAAKTKYLPTDASEKVAMLVSRILFPIMLFCIFASPSLSVGQILDSRGLLIAAAVWTLVCLMVGFAVAKGARLEAGKAPVFTVLMTMSNTTYMGIPICTALFGEAFGTLGAAVCTLAAHLVMWTVGVLMMRLAGKGKSKKGFSLGGLISPVTIAIALGLVVKFCGLSLPEILYHPLDAIGDTTPWIALLYIGMLMAQVPARELLLDGSVYLFLAVKLLFLPLGLAGLLRILPLPLGADTKRLLLVEFSTSAMISITPYLRDQGYRGDYSATLVFLSILCNILTLPLVLWIYQL